MSTALGRYSAVLRGTGAAAPLVASVLGRIPLGMTGLAVLLLVREATGSYAAAGLVSAAYALAFALVSPVRARSADRRGPRPVLAAMGLVHPLALGALVALAAGGAGPALLLAAAVAAGATVPPLGAVMRALWGQLVGGPALTTAYAIESVVIEICFVAGPLLVAVLTALSGPSAAVLAAGGLTLIGALALVRTPALRAVRPVLGAVHPLGPLTAAPVRALLLTSASVGAGFGAVEVAMPAFLEQGGQRPGLAGVLLAVWSLGSLAGGLAYGGLHPATPHRRQLPWLVAALAAASVLPLAAAPALQLIVMSLALFAYGLTIAPLGACTSVLLSGAAPVGTVTEAFAWNSSMIFGGAAFGAAAAGVLVERSGVVAALALTAGTGALVLLFGLRAGRRLVPVAV
ncbi:MAG TPA: MFS transporter [Mycobacteriales bacterium]|nr:MFS transporter [Mycobacteriales bacterium]